MGRFLPFGPKLLLLSAKAVYNRYHTDSTDNTTAEKGSQSKIQEINVGASLQSGWFGIVTLKGRYYYLLTMKDYQTGRLFLT